MNIMKNWKENCRNLCFLQKQLKETITNEKTSKPKFCKPKFFSCNSLSYRIFVWFFHFLYIFVLFFPFFCAAYQLPFYGTLQLKDKHAASKQASSSQTDWTILWTFLKFFQIQLLSWKICIFSFVLSSYGAL